MANSPNEASDETGRDSVLEVALRAVDVERLDQSAARRGVTRQDVMSEAIDAFLAREMWSGAYIPPPPRMEVPRRYPWRSGAFRIGRRDERSA